MRNSPDVLLDAPVEQTPLPEVRNHTPFPSQYYQMMDGADEVFHVLVSRLTYDLDRLDEAGVPTLAAAQTPLVAADRYPGDPTSTSCIEESDFAPFKPRCDIVLAHAVAHAPEGRPCRRWAVSMGIGAWQKNLVVTGPRFVESTLLGWKVTTPEKAMRVPLRWEMAYGGTCQWPRQPVAGQDPEILAACDANPIGTGWVDKAWYKKAQVADVDAPQIEVYKQPFGGDAANRMCYPAVGVGPVGKSWRPRRELAGTYDEDWKANRWPRLPADFDFGYWNGAPHDQQIAWPKGGEHVIFAGFDASRNVTQCRLPSQHPFARVRLHAGPILPRAMQLDTLVFDLKARTLACVYRMTLAARADVQVLELCR